MRTGKSSHYLRMSNLRGGIVVTSALPASSPTSLTSHLTNLAHQPPHQPPYQPPHQPCLPASSPTSFTSLLTNLLYQPLPLAISKVGCKAKNHVYIWDLYPTIWGGSLSLLLTSSHQARNIITKPPIALPHNLSHISPIFSICAIPPSTAPTTPSTILQSLLLPSSNIALQQSSQVYWYSCIIWTYKSQQI